MALQVKITRKASLKIKSLLEYLEVNWSVRVKAEFIEKLEKAIKLVAVNPDGFPKSNIVKGLHKCVVTKQTTLYYSYDSKYLNNLNNAGLPIRKAFLYGSYARNEANETSDIDVLLVSDVFDTQDDMVLSKPWSPILRFDYRLEPYVVGKKWFMSDDVSLILEMVRCEGIEVTA